MQVGSSVNKMALNLFVDTFPQVSKSHHHINRKNKVKIKPVMNLINPEFSRFAHEPTFEAKLGSILTII